MDRSTNKIIESVPPVRAARAASPRIAKICVFRHFFLASNDQCVYLYILPKDGGNFSVHASYLFVTIFKRRFG
jgi:hypothetical protein